MNVLSSNRNILLAIWVLGSSPPPHPHYPISCLETSAWVENCLDFIDIFFLEAVEMPYLFNLIWRPSDPFVYSYDISFKQVQFLHTDKLIVVKHIQWEDLLLNQGLFLSPCMIYFIVFKRWFPFFSSLLFVFFLLTVLRAILSVS